MQVKEGAAVVGEPELPPPPPPPPPLKGYTRRPPKTLDGFPKISRTQLMRPKNIGKSAEKFWGHITLYVLYNLLLSKRSNKMSMIS